VARKESLDQGRVPREEILQRGWTQSISTQAGLQDAVTAIRTALLNAASR